MSGSYANPSKTKAGLLALKAGLESALPKGVSQIILAGRAVDVADVVQTVDDYASLYQAVEDAEDQRRHAVVARRSAEARVKQFVQQLEVSLRGLFGVGDAGLRKFGIEPPAARKQLTGEQIVARAEKARATRAARGTMGKRQKQAIHGVVPATPASGAPQAPTER